MKVGVRSETAPGERRVALIPDAVKALGERGVDVVVEAGAGEGAGHPDSQYTEAGAEIGDPWGAEIVVTWSRCRRSRTSAGCARATC